MILVHTSRKKVFPQHSHVPVVTDTTITIPRAVPNRQTVLHVCPTRLPARLSSACPHYVEFKLHHSGSIIVKQISPTASFLPSFLSCRKINIRKLPFSPRFDSIWVHPSQQTEIESYLHTKSGNKNHLHALSQRPMITKFDTVHCHRLSAASFSGRIECRAPTAARKLLFHIIRNPRRFVSACAIDTI